jgi:hypothetical protein
MNKIIFIVSILSLLWSCGSSKKITHAELMETAPEWVKQTPNHPAYYQGVGRAVKTIQPDYRERARQNALSELAAGISVNISSSSVLNQFEFDNSYNEFFRDNIKVSVQQYLEGYEMVDEWETDQQYYVYYRLAKSRFEEIKQQRIESSLNLSVSKFEQARDMSLQGKTFDAIGFYIKAVEDIRNFLADDLSAEIDGTSRTYSTFLIGEMMSQIRGLKIIFPMENLSVKPGSDNASRPFDVLVKDTNGNPVANLPVKTTFSWLPGKQYNAFTDARGVFRITPERIVPGLSNEMITAVVDMKKIAENQTDDLMVQRLFTDVSASQFTLPIEVIPPVFRVLIDNPHASAMSVSLRNEVSNLFSQDGIKITQTDGQQDYNLLINMEFTDPVLLGNRYTNKLKANIIIEDSMGRTLHSSSVDDVSGLGSSTAEAIDDAFNSFKGSFRILLYPAMKKQIFNP